MDPTTDEGQEHTRRALNGILSVADSKSELMRSSEGEFVPSEHSDSDCERSESDNEPECSSDVSDSSDNNIVYSARSRRNWHISGTPGLTRYSDKTTTISETLRHFLTDNGHYLQIHKGRWSTLL
jgi:hypothetical protein